jgi:hypothetical protein
LVPARHPAQHWKIGWSSPSITKTDAVVMEQAGAVLGEIRAAIQFHLEGLKMVSVSVAEAWPETPDV